MLFKALIWFVFFYLMFKVYRFFKKVMRTVPKNESNVKSAVTESSKINKSDIIDADFEDLPITEKSEETLSEDK